MVSAREFIIYYNPTLVLPNERLYLENLPTQDLYEVSYNHRDTVTHLIATKSGSMLCLGVHIRVVQLWLVIRDRVNACLYYLSIPFLDRTDFIISASCDGHIKFWKKKPDIGIEFVKHLRSHLGLRVIR